MQVSLPLLHSADQQGSTGEYPASMLTRIQSWELSSRSPAKRDAPPDLPSVGMRGKTTNEDGSPPLTNEKEISALYLYLTVDAPHSYQEAMRRPDADEWVAAIAE